MEVILREDVEKLGNRGQMVKVADGYARNFLLPKRLAVPATDANKKIVEQERQAHLRREAKQKGEAEDLAKLLNGVIGHHRAEGRREGPVVRLGHRPRTSPRRSRSRTITIDRRKIHLDEPIKQLGEYKVPVQLHRDVTAEIQVNVVKEEE